VVWNKSWRHAGFQLGEIVLIWGPTGADWGLLLTRKLGMSQLDSYDKKSNIIKVIIRALQRDIMPIPRDGKFLFLLSLLRYAASTPQSL
jgi:hypothetical protein